MWIKMLFLSNYEQLTRKFMEKRLDALTDVPSSSSN